MSNKIMKYKSTWKNAIPWISTYLIARVVVAAAVMAVVVAVAVVTAAALGGCGEERRPLACTSF